MNTISPINFDTYKYKKQVTFSKKQVQQKSISNEPKSNLQSQSAYYGITSNIFSSIPTTRTKPALYFKPILSDEDLAFLADTEGKTKDILEKMLRLKTTEGKCFFSHDVLSAFKKNQFNLSDEEIDNILKRDLINPKIENEHQIFEYAKLDDKHWDGIKDFSHNLFATFEKNSFMIYTKYGKEHPLKEYQTGRLRVEDIKELYAICRISDLLQTKDSDKNELFIKAIDIYSNLTEIANIQKKNLEMLFELIKSNKLPANAIIHTTLSSKINNNLKNDLVQLFEAYSTGENPKETFVPYFKTRKEANKALRTGDVCILKGNKFISIKMPENYVKDLCITPNTYFKLFPPVERFISNQQKSGDCYLVSTVDELYANPKTRHKILELFAENQDGTISMVFGGFELQDKPMPKMVSPQDITITDLESELKNNISQKPHLFSASCEGKRAIQILWEKYYSDKAKNYIENFKSAIFNAHKNKVEFLDYNNTRYSKFDINNLVDMFNSDEDIVVYGINDEKSYFDYNDLKELFFTIHMKKRTNTMEHPAKTSDEIFRFEFLSNMLLRYIDSIEPQDGKCQIIEPMPLKTALLLKTPATNEITKDNYYRIDGGLPNNVLNKFGIYSETLKWKKDGKELLDIFNNPDCNSKYIILGSTRTKPNTKPNVKGNSRIEKTLNKELGIYSNHSYVINPIKVNGETIFRVRNPWNTTFEFILNLNQLNEYFKAFTVGFI